MQLENSTRHAPLLQSYNRVGVVRYLPSQVIIIIAINVITARAHYLV